MNNNNQIPKGYKPYKTIEGKFAAHIGPYYIKYKYPRTVFIVFIDNKLSNLNNVAHGGFLMVYADSVGGFYAYNKVNPDWASYLVEHSKIGGHRFMYYD